MTLAKPRGAPPIAAKNAAMALANIVRKRDLIVHMLERSNAVGSIEAVKDLPKSIRQFNRWSGGSVLEQLEAPQCRPNSNQTLSAHAEMRHEIQSLVNMVRTVGQQQFPSRREEAVRALRARLKTEKDLTAIANRELLRARVLLSELRERYDIVKYAKRSSDQEAKRALEELQSSIAKLEAENADLKKRLAKDSRLRSV